MHSGQVLCLMLAIATAGLIGVFIRGVLHGSTVANNGNKKRNGSQLPLSYSNKQRGPLQVILAGYCLHFSMTGKKDAVLDKLSF